MEAPLRRPEPRPEPQPGPISRRAYSCISTAFSWEEIWEAGPYYERISEILEDARHYAIFAGWQIDSRLLMHRPTRPRADARETLPPGQRPRETLKEKIIRLCESKPEFQFYFLMWDHAYFYVLERETWQGRIWENIHPRVHFIFDNRHPFGASHHEKICVVDGKVAFVGGIDLCDERWDSPQHLYFDPRRSLDWRREHHGPYHDLAVQVTGPVCAEIQRHVAGRWRALSSIPFPDPPVPMPVEEAGAAGHRIYLSRTQASIDATDRHPIVREIEFLYRDLIRSARKRIILEGQYYWSASINDLLTAKIEEMRGTDFEIVLVLAELGRIKSLTRLMTRYELSLLERLRETASRCGVRLITGAPHVFPSPEETGRAPRPVYIHSKILVVDDRFVAIGTANFATRALRIDTEINLTLEARTEAERAHVRRLSQAILSHWGVAGVARAGAPDVRLRPYFPRLRLSAAAQARKGSAPWGTRIPYQNLFDPGVPWLYLFKRRFRNLARRRRLVAAAALAAGWALGAALAVTVAWDWDPRGADGAWPALYAGLLSSAWWLPVPFTLTALYASVQFGGQLGGETGARAAVAGCWSAAFLGYTLARMFPAIAARYYRKTGPLWLPQRLGLRSFPTLVSVLADPRVSLRSKIAYQGLYCVPLPWFALGTGLILPAALYVLCRWAAALAPAAWSAGLREWSAEFFLGMLAWSFGKFALRLWKNAA